MTLPSRLELEQRFLDHTGAAHGPQAGCTEHHGGANSCIFLIRLLLR